MTDSDFQPLLDVLNVGGAALVAPFIVFLIIRIFFTWIWELLK